MQGEKSIRCAGCSKEPLGAALGWRAFIAGGYDDEPLELGVFCPDCVEREAAEAQAA